MIKRYQVVCVFFLLIISSIGSLSFGEDSSKTEKNKLLEDLAFLCTTPNGFNEMKYECYKKQLLKQDSDEDIKEHVISDSEELIKIQNSPSMILSDGPMDSAWPMHGHDVHHTGQSPYSTADNPLDTKWKIWNSDWIEVTPAIDNNGTIYVNGYYGGKPFHLLAYSPNGTLKWGYKTDGNILWSSPAIAEDGTIYVGSWDSCLHAINCDGTRKWRFPTNGNIASSPAIGEDGTIYFGNLGDFGYDSRIYAVYPNGTQKWCYSINDRIYSDPAIGDDGTIYIGSNDNFLYALNPDGTLKWKFKTGKAVGGFSIADDGTVYVGGVWDNYFYALYPNNGSIKWKINIWTNSNPSIGSDGTIYTGGDEEFYAIYPNGTRKWTFDLGNERWTAGTCPAISDDGTIYVSVCVEEMSGGVIYAINPDGTERWRKKIAKKWVHASPSIGEDGTVYIGSSYDMGGGYLYAFGRAELDADANGPYFGLTNQPLQFTGTSYGGYHPHSYHWDFGDTQTSEEQNPTHTYTNPGNYTVTLTVTDNTSNTTSDMTWAWVQETNNLPDKPTIDGPTNGNVKTSYPYNVSTSDLDESIIWYYIDWGDNTSTGWIGPYDSGKEITKSHSWNKKGTYIIKVKAKDPYNAESSEATLEVTMPRNRATIGSLFLRFLKPLVLLYKMTIRFLLQ
jgi:outer membrane protein assembly factor BamB